LAATFNKNLFFSKKVLGEAADCSSHQILGTLMGRMHLHKQLMFCCDVVGVFFVFILFL